MRGGTGPDSGVRTQRRTLERRTLGPNTHFGNADVAEISRKIEIFFLTLCLHFAEVWCKSCANAPTHRRFWQGRHTPHVPTWSVQLEPQLCSEVTLPDKRTPTGLPPVTAKAAQNAFALP